MPWTSSTDEAVYPLWLGRPSLAAHCEKQSPPETESNPQNAALEVSVMSTHR